MKDIKRNIRIGVESIGMLVGVLGTLQVIMMIVTKLSQRVADTKTLMLSVGVCLAICCITDIFWVYILSTLEKLGKKIDGIGE